MRSYVPCMSVGMFKKIEGRHDDKDLKYLDLDLCTTWRDVFKALQFKEGAKRKIFKIVGQVTEELVGQLVTKEVKLMKKLLDHHWLNRMFNVLEIEYQIGPL